MQLVWKVVNRYHMKATIDGKEIYSIAKAFHHPPRYLAFWLDTEKQKLVGPVTEDINVAKELCERHFECLGKIGKTG